MQMRRSVHSLDSDETVFLFEVVENEDEVLHLFAGGPMP